ncbi:methyltransferase [Mycolicibacterium canariasense]|uniref:S-adenosyl-L-methionine-dependent methyltransferase n=1 Tax=Mycolicibacterium canariasense TaxID=228230 RepID=A0A117IA02_MYCCR|nr:SAM-dependent methyltransferase [Mycolicibacterium canariasense]MCV7212539.1 class I SAM-dependent methyltransferase [Mycolicibacterium canariasense]ORV05392.1 methyltransferase [Mycolicibacterium canariasense]GAS95599.1 methyltransferase [Mycolicibacterium canariasense]
MDKGPSRTALATAYARAYHQIADQPMIFSDDLAVPLLGVTADELTELSTRVGDQIGAVINDRDRRLFFAARARVAEDAVAAAVAAGTRQVVILGAGLDTFAYRNHNPGLRVFEIDHPATQAWKRDRLAAAGIDIPATLTLVPVDFETQDLSAELESTAFTRTEPAIFVWLGVIFYLTPSAARSTLQYIAGQAQPVEVVFDYLHSPSTEADRADLQARAERLAAAGEPFHSYFTPTEITTLLRTLGFRIIDDRPGYDVVAAYLGEGSSDGGELEFARVLQASRILRARR